MNFDLADDKTPIPSPNLLKDDERNRLENTFISSPPIIINEDTKTFVRAQSFDSTVTSDIRPSLLQRAQLFLQKQLDVLTSHNSGSDSDLQTKSISTSLWTTQLVEPVDPSSKLTTVTNTESVLNSSFTLDNSSSEVKSSVCEAKSLPLQNSNILTSQNANNLPPQNVRHLSPEVQMKLQHKTSDRGLSPYRQMPELMRGNNQFLQLSPVQGNYLFINF